jgi:nitroimidazol reductase NimA-like FMN-containing flavoprotein (pyridoxamine 5'-phosphate oxidase superfamily)
MSNFSTTKRNQVNRLPNRGHYDSETVYAILDEALICHVAFTEDDHQPVVIPSLFARMDNTILLHGAKASRMIKHIQAGKPVSLTVSLLDGLVVARSVFHHSVNYRSVVLFGIGHLVDQPEEKMRALEVLTEHILPGRWADARKPNPKEMNATSVVSIPIESASAKIRTGLPVDDEEDYDLPVWAGVLPLQQQPLEPIADPRLGPGIPVPAYLSGYRRGKM